MTEETITIKKNHLEWLAAWMFFCGACCGAACVGILWWAPFG